MRAIVYSETGAADEVLSLVERPVPEPGPGEVRVKIVYSGVNPTDWKSRSGATAQVEFDEVTPNQDGSGIVDAVGSAVTDLAVGDRVWVWEAAHGRPFGTAAEYTVVPARQAVLLPDSASFELGAALPIPAMTAHRALTVRDGGPRRLDHGVLAGLTVLVQGGAGAVGHAAIQLAKWAGAEVVTTVSSDDKAALARSAGADHVVNYKTSDAAVAIRTIAPEGVDVIVEVAPGPNAELDAAVIAEHGTIAVYADNGSTTLTLPIRAHMGPNTRYQFILVYRMGDAAKGDAVASIREAVSHGILTTGEDTGLPLTFFDLADTAAAHEAVRNGAVGKVLVTVSEV